MNAGRSALRRSALGTLAALLMLGVSVPAASAVTGHRFDQSIGTGDFGGVADVAVRSGVDLFAADSGNQTLRRYSLTGVTGNVIDVTPELQGPSLVARDQTNGRVYVAGSDPATFAGVIYRYGPDGSSPTQIALGDSASVSGMATNPLTGTLYVADASTNTIRTFNQSGVEGPNFGTDPLTSVGRLSVDGSGNVYVLQFGTGILKLDSTGAVAGTIDSPTAQQLAATPVANGDVFVVESPNGQNPGITRYNTAGEFQQRFAESPAASGFVGLSVDGPTRAVYVVNANNQAVDRYVEFTAPDVVTNDTAANDITTTTARVTGTANPNGQANTRYQFEYGTDATLSLGSLPATPVSVGNGNAPVAAATTLPDLEPNTTYFYRAVGINDLGSNAGAIKTFTTAAAPPTVSGESVSNITPTTASLSALVNPRNTPGTAKFEYGLTQQYEAGESRVSNVTGGQDVAVTQTIGQLQPDSVYYYRVVADNGVSDPVRGTGGSFRTLPAQPTARADQATNVTSASAQINGTVDTQGLTGTYSFDITARDGSYTATTPTRTLGAANGPRAVSETLTGLPTGLTYDVRLRLETSTGAVTSELASTFVTRPEAALPAPAPALAADPFPYGCAAPRLTAPKGTLEPGENLTLTGSDLGVFGRVAFGSRSGYVERWSANRVVVEVPSRATGRVPITVICGRRSNTVTARVASNRFSASTNVDGTSATVKVKVPGKGAVSVSGRGIRGDSASPSKAGTVSLEVALTRAGEAALRDARSGALKVKVAIRYRPAGGTTRKATRTLTFRR